MMVTLYHIRDLKHALVLSAVAYHVRGRQRKITLIGDNRPGKNFERYQK